MRLSTSFRLTDRLAPPPRMASLTVRARSERWSSGHLRTSACSVLECSSASQAAISFVRAFLSASPACTMSVNVSFKFQGLRGLPNLRTIVIRNNSFLCGLQHVVMCTDVCADIYAPEEQDTFFLSPTKPTHNIMGRNMLVLQ